MSIPTRPIILAGIKHCGKSTIGQLLARHWHAPFVDTDSEIEKEFHRQTGQHAKIREIYLAVGEEKFRRAEEKVIGVLADMPGFKVIALGGGAVDNRFVDMELLRKLGFGIWLDIAPEIAYARIVRRGLPPFLASATDPQEEFQKICKQREARFQLFAELRFPIKQEIPAAEVAGKIADLIEKGVKS
ncbi:MAG: shikimate kinase [Victivallales bacterium]|jgi:shikimate kinase|nr:shikimate kinase [Victivallales bacterium]